MKILTLNTGSGSQQCSLFALPDGPLPDEPLAPVWEAKLDATDPSQPAGKIVPRIRRGGETIEAEALDESSSAVERTQRLLSLLGDTGEIAAVGHRVVHGGADFDRAVRVDAEVEAAIERFGAFAPLHHAANLAGIRVAREVLGNKTPQIAVFDTAFHKTLAPAAFTYAGPREWLARGIRRYGFHGTSFRWASERAAQLLGRAGDRELRLILCHLGGGCSLCATVGGRSIDTTMGFTPLDGIAMSTRSGAVDPGILIYLMREGATAGEIERTLNQESGLKGVSGLSGDTRILSPRAAQGDPHAKLALDVFLHRLRAGIGQMLAALGTPPHALVFTDAIAESEPALRAAACETFAFLGLQLDAARNAASPLDADLASEKSAVRILLIASREAWQIARECHALANA